MRIKIAVSVFVALNLIGIVSATTWWNTDWSYRMQLNVSAGSYNRENPVVIYTVNFTQLLRGVGDSAQLDENSIRLINDDTSSETIYQFDHGANYNGSTNAIGNLTFVSTDSILSGGVEAYHLYFDSGSGKSSPSYSTSWGDVYTPSNRIENSLLRAQWAQISNYGPGSVDFLPKSSGNDQCNNLISAYARIDAYKPGTSGWTAIVQSTELEDGAVRKKMQVIMEGEGNLITQNVTLYRETPYLISHVVQNMTVAQIGYWGTPGGDSSGSTTDSTVNGTVGSYTYRGVYDNANGEGYELIIKSSQVDGSSWEEFEQDTRYGFQLNSTSSELDYFIVAVTSGSSEITAWPDRLLNPVVVMVGSVIQAPVCGDSTCESSKGETEANCWDDCHIIVCGDGICEGDEDESSCPNDCYINIEIQQPYSGQQYSLGDILRIRVKATTPKGLDVQDASATVYAPFETPYTTTLKDDGNHNDAFANDAVYGEETVIQPSAGVGIYNLTVNISKWDGMSSEKVQIEIRDELSTTATISNTTFYKGYDMLVSGRVSSIRGVVRDNSTFRITFSSGTWVFNDEFETDTSGDFSYTYPISFADPDGVWKITLGGNDSHGNQLNKTFTVNVVTPSQILYYGVFFSTSPLLVYTRGDEIPVSVFVRKGDEAIEQANVSYKDPAGQRRYLNEITPGYYEDVYRIPMNAPTGQWVLAVQAIKYENNTLQAGASTYYNINITPMRFVYDLIEPTRFVFTAGEPITFTLSVKYGNGTPVTGASVKAASPSGEILIFDESETRGYYTKTYTSSNAENGSWSLTILATDSNENFALVGKEILIKENIPLIPPWGWIVMVAILVSSALFWKVNGEARYYRWKFIKLKSESDRIETMKGIVEERYFNRRIDEETYTKLMREYEEQGVEILSKIASIRERAKLKGKKPNTKKPKKIKPKETEPKPEPKPPQEEPEPPRELPPDGSS